MENTNPSDKPTPIATCHCGRIAITMPSPPKSINECHCSVCYKLGALWAYYPRAQVAVTTSSPIFPSSSLPASSEGRPVGVRHITRGINTAVDEALDSYVRTDLPGGKSNITFYRCAHCGALTHHWGASTRRGEDGDGPITGVNCRLLPEKEIEGVKRTVTVC
ncbi:Mss4-like protein [Xylaria palmicola]|nr:Mss4-like protein [Xylaria palmicola]